MAAKLEVELDLDAETSIKDTNRKLGNAGKKAGKSFSVNFSSALKVGALLVAARAV